MSAYTLIDYDVRSNVAYITLNDPETLNAMSPDMGAELSKALDQAVLEARSIVLTGAGRGFCSGANLMSGGMDLTDPERDAGIRLERLYNPMINKIRDLPIPFVTAVHGAAAGIGSSFALMGDIIVAGKSAFFLQAFCNIGLVPDGGAPYLLSRAVGRVRAMELTLLGERYPAERAYADGLITRLVDDSDVQSTASEIAEKLAKGPTQSLKLIRKSVWAAQDQTLADQLDLERGLQKQAGATKDHIEGVTAFREKRKPAFTGE